MSRKERERMTVMVGVTEQELTLVAAAGLMGVCYRQSKRIWRRYQADGDAGLGHRLRGKPSARRKPAQLRTQALARYAEERYADFGPTLMAEQLLKEKLVVDHETLRRWGRKHGLPASLYVDRDNLYRCEGVASMAEQLAGKPPQTQFGRAMEQLGIELILANRPQAKGRVERMNGTLQGRLVKELRLAGINAIESANRFLDGKYLRAFHRQFARAAASPVDVHRAGPRNLNEVLSWEEARVVQGDWTVVGAGTRYPLDRQHAALSLVRRPVIVRTLRNRRVQLVYRGKQLKWRLLPKGSVRKSAAKKAKQAKRKTGGQPPAKNHPWRRDGVGFGRKYWHGIKVRGRAVRLAGRDSGQPPLRSGLPASRPASRGNRAANNSQQRGHSLVS